MAIVTYISDNFFFIAMNYVKKITFLQQNQTKVISSYLLLPTTNTYLMLALIVQIDEV